MASKVRLLLYLGFGGGCIGGRQAPAAGLEIDVEANLLFWSSGPRTSHIYVGSTKDVVSKYISPNAGGIDCTLHACRFDHIHNNGLTTSRVIYDQEHGGQEGEGIKCRSKEDFLSLAIGSMHTDHLGKTYIARSKLCPTAVFSLSDVLSLEIFDASRLNVLAKDGS